MNKKIPLILVFIVIIAWFVYRAMHAPVAKNEVVIESETKIAADKNIPPSLKINQDAKTPHAENGEVKSRVYEKEDASFEEFDKMDEAWLVKAKEIVGEDKYALYLDMRKRNDDEKLIAYKEYHNYLRQKYGDKFSYNLSEDQSAREKQINQKYLKELLKLIGPEAFKKYTAEKDQFNEKMRRQNKESIQVEF
jgi:hypothetical protein